MKKLFLLFVLIMSVSVIAAQTQTKSCCKKDKAGKTAACCKKGMATADAGVAGGTQTATDQDKSATLCPSMAAGEKCTDPNCAYSHDMTAENTAKCDKSQGGSWWRFWEKNSDKDCCKKP